MDPDVFGAVNESMGRLVELALDRWTLMICGAVYFSLRTLNRQTWLNQRKWWLRILPVLPDVLGLAFSCAGLVPASAHMNMLVRVAIGLWVGYLSQRFHKLLGQTILGDDDALASLFARAKAADTPTKPEGCAPPPGDK